MERNTTVTAKSRGFTLAGARPAAAISPPDGAGQDGQPPHVDEPLRPGHQFLGTDIRRIGGYRAPIVKKRMLFFYHRASLSGASCLINSLSQDAGQPELSFNLQLCNISDSVRSTSEQASRNASSSEGKREVISGVSPCPGERSKGWTPKMQDRLIKAQRSGQFQSFRQAQAVGGDRAGLQNHGSVSIGKEPVFARSEVHVGGIHQDHRPAPLEKRGGNRCGIGAFQKHATRSQMPRPGKAPGPGRDRFHRRGRDMCPGPRFAIRIPPPAQPA